MPEPLRPALTGDGHAAVRNTKDLRTYHLNPRVGDVAAIAQSLDVNGQYRPIVVNAGSMTGRPNEVLAGNHTLLGARSLGWPTIQTWEVDVDDVTAARIVAADNRTADLGSYDEAALVALLGEIADDDAGLAGTGYTEEDLGKMLAAGAPAVGSADAGFADADGIDVENQFGVIVMCDDETDQAAIYERLGELGRPLRVVTV